MTPLQHRKAAVAAALACGALGVTSGLAAASTPSSTTGESVSSLIGIAQLSGYAVVAADGTLIRDKDVSEVVHVAGSGLYEVHFAAAEASTCAPVATLADPGTIVSSGAQMASSVVRVQTADYSGDPADRSFQLVLVC